MREYDNWHSIIVKVDSIMRIYGDNGLETFLKDFFPLKGSDS